MRIAILAGLVASGLLALLAFSVQSSEAASMTFTTDTTIFAYVTVEADEVLTVNPGVTVTIRNAGIINHGTINNYGTINNDYLILNKPTGTINNNGTINNYDIFNTDPMSITNNFGIFNNYYNVNNFGTIHNFGTFNHYYGNSIGNYGSFNNHCGATFIDGGGLDGDEPIVSIPCPDTNPPEVTITSAVDGDGNVVANGGSTQSDSMTFGFHASDGEGSIDHFDCYLISADLVNTTTPCISPMIYSSLDGGNYQLVVNATDSSGNQGIATFEFTILETHTIEDLLDEINEMDIASGLKNSLKAPLNQALALLSDDNPNNDKATCGKLQAFVDQVNAKAGKGLTNEQAEELLDIASAIKDDLAC